MHDVDPATSFYVPQTSETKRSVTKRSVKDLRRIVCATALSRFVTIAIIRIPQPPANSTHRCLRENRTNCQVARPCEQAYFRTSHSPHCNKWHDQVPACYLPLRTWSNQQGAHTYPAPNIPHCRCKWQRQPASCCLTDMASNRLPK